MASAINNINFCPKSKRSQLTIFVIIALIIVVAAVIIYLIYPKISAPSISLSPVEQIQNCLEDEIQEKTEQISLNGGSLNPQFYSNYYFESKKYTVEYLCYTNEYYKQCVMQQPLLKSHIENEIKNAINKKVGECFDTLEKDLIKKGYSVDLKRNDYNIEINSGKIKTTINYELTLSKESTNKYDEFVVSIDSNLYRLVNIANKILLGEAELGDADISSYMDANYWLKAVKRKLTDGTKIYTLTDKDTENKFMFASRSVVWPPGSGI